jgi:plasmid stability protein
MPTLYVENVPKDLYEALRKRAKSNRKSIAAEVIDLLRHTVPTAAALAKRQKLWEEVLQFRSQPSPAPGPFPSTEEMLREDRNR